MKRLSGKLIQRAAVTFAALALAAVTTTAVLASGAVTIMTPAASSEELVIDGTSLGTLPVYNGQAQMMFSWTRYWDPYWPTYPNPQPTDKAYKVAIWQNTTPLAATPTWVELHTSDHWIDDANPTRFTFDTLLESENPCQDCPSIVVVRAESFTNVVDENGDSHITYIPATAPNASGVSAEQRSGQFLIKGYTRIQDNRCPYTGPLKWICAFL